MYDSRPKIYACVIANSTKTQLGLVKAFNQSVYSLMGDFTSKDSAFLKREESSVKSCMITLSKINRVISKSMFINFLTQSSLKSNILEQTSKIKPYLEDLSNNF